MSDIRFALFDTAIGPCGIVWSARGIAGVQLAEANAPATRKRLIRRYPGAQEAMPPAEVKRTIEDMVGLLAGESRDLSSASLDSEGCADFHRRVCAIARTVPAGSTITYGEIAAQLGDKALARDVGEALSENPWPLIVPCHRVLAAGGKAGGFSGPGGVTTKLRLLSIEGAQPGGPTLFDRLPLSAPRQRRA